MCLFDYCYFTNCHHGELIRVSYCAAAEALGLPIKHDCWHGSTHFARRAPEPAPVPALVTQAAEASDSPKNNRSALFADSDQFSQGTLGFEKLLEPRQAMATVPSQPRRALSWAEVVASPTNHVRPGLDLVPRAVHLELPSHPSDLVSGPRYHQQPSHPSSYSGSTEHNDFNINIPLDHSSQFSVSITHDGKVQEIVTRFESLCLRDNACRSFSDDVSVYADDSHTRASSSSTVRQPNGGNADPARHVSSTIDTNGRTSSQAFEYLPQEYLPQTSPDTHTGPRIRFAPDPKVLHSSTRTSPRTLSKRSTNGKQYSPGSPESESPRKPLPSHWTNKTSAPMLATAQRAMQRETRRQSRQPENPAQHGHKTIRGTRSCVDLDRCHATEAGTYLTKEAIDAVQGDIVAKQPLASPQKLGRITSKTTVKSPTGSPTRSSISSNVKIIWSPTTNAHSHTGSRNVASDNLLVRYPKHSKAGSVSSRATTGTGYVTANESPVSHTSRISEGEYVSALSEHEQPLPASRRASSEELEQTNDSPTPCSFTIKRRTDNRPETDAKSSKAGSARKFAPRLSLKIPVAHSMRDRKQPLCFATEPNSSTGTLPSPPHASRIPRKLRSTEGEDKKAGTLRRTRLKKSLDSASAATESFQGIREGSPILRDIDGQFEGRYRRDSHAVPTPKTPIAQVATVRHVRTVDSNGVTPILQSRQARSTVKPPSSTTSEDTLVKTEHHHDQLALSAESDVNIVDKQSMVRTYLGMNASSDQAVQSWRAGSFSTSPSTANGVLPSLDIASFKPSSKPRSDTPTSPFQQPPMGSDGVQTTNRVVSIDSEATITGTMMEPDGPAEHETRMTDELGPGEEDMSPLCTSLSLGSTLGAPVATLQDRGRKQQFIPQSRIQTHSELSLRSSLTSSDLRPEAAIFVPQQSVVQESESPVSGTNESDAFVNEPTYQTFKSPWDPTTAFNPFIQDTYGIPMYHLMYPVHVGPNTGYDFARFKRSWSPRKGRNWRPVGNSKSRRRRERRSTTDASSAIAPSSTESVSPSERTIDSEVHMATPNDCAASCATEKPAEDASEHTAIPTSQDEEPFSSQLKSVLEQSKVVAEHESAVQAEPNRIDWTSLSNVPRRRNEGPAWITTEAESAQVRQCPYGLTLPRMQYNATSYSHLYPQNAHNGTFHGGHRYNGRRRWNNSAGIPLESSAPFPDPVAPSGPQPLDAQKTASRDYVGYFTDEARKGCGKIEIRKNTEWQGQVCNACEGDQQQSTTAPDTS